MKTGKGTEKSLMDTNLEKIFDFPLKKIREAYFKGKLSKLLSEMQAKKEFKEEDIVKLKEYQEKGIMKNLKGVVPEFEEKVFLEDLSKDDMSKEEKERLEKEKVKRLSNVNTVNNILLKISQRFASQKNVPGERELIDMALEVNGLKYYVDDECLYREQLYRKKVVEFEARGKQRLTAEEYAKTTNEYRNYKKLQNLKKRVEVQTMIAMKQYKGL